MNTYKYKSISTVYTSGVITESIEDFLENILRLYLTSQNSNILYILNGDCGIGSYDLEYYHSIFSKYNDSFSKRNIHIAFVRGEDDNPAYFEDELINYSNIKTIPDYSIIKTPNMTCLCIGGAVSINRSWKVKEEQRLKDNENCSIKRLYWKNEMPIINNNELDNLKEKIDVVITHASPSFAQSDVEYIKHKISRWAGQDESLLDDILKERTVLDEIFAKLLEMKNIPKTWVFSHLCTQYQSVFNNVCFTSLDRNELIKLNTNNTINSRKSKRSNSILEFV